MMTNGRVQPRRKAITQILARTLSDRELMLSGARVADGNACQACAADEAQDQEELRHVSQVVINENSAENEVDPLELHIAHDITAFGPSSPSPKKASGE